MHPTPTPLSPDIHRHGQQSNPNCNTANGKETISDTLRINPPINVEGQTEGKNVFDKVHRCKSLACFIAVAVDDVRYDSRGAELYAKIDEAQAYNYRDRPGVDGVERLAPSEEAGCGEEKVSNHDGEAEFGFCLLLHLVSE